jgi:hypothetical protein
MTAARAAAALLACACATAHAQSASTGIAVDRLTPAVGPNGFAGIEGGATTPAGAVSWMGSLGFLRDPIVLERAFGGGVVTRPVHEQLTTQVALEYGVWRRLAVLVGVPVVLYQDGDRLRGLGLDDARLQATVAGDIRVRLKASLVGDPRGSGWHLGLALTVTAPGGGQHDFAATSGATLEPRLMADWHGSRLALGATVGARFAEDRTLLLTTFGDELVYGAAASLALVARPAATVTLIAEVEGGAGASSGTRPVELRGAVRAGLRALSIDAGAGFGADDDTGAPAWRVFVITRGTLPLTH